MNKLLRMVQVVLSCLVVIVLIPSHVFAEQKSLSDLINFTGSALVDDWVAFSPISSMTFPRYRHTATLLNNDRVLVTGGYNNVPLSSAELFDSTIQKWTVTGAMNNARVYHTATLLKNGKVLAVSLANAEVYDPDTEKWTLTGNLNFRHDYHAATLLNNGKVLVTGGPNLKTAELYDPNTGTWTLTGSMNYARYYHTATLLTDGKVLVAGGYDGTYSLLSSSELYDPISGTWTINADMNEPRAQIHTATMLFNGKVLIAGGNYNKSAELFDPASGIWSLTGEMLDFYFSSMVTTLLQDGNVLLTGNGAGGINSEVFNSDTNTWNKTGDMTDAREYDTITTLNTGNVLILGGALNSALDSTILGTYFPSHKVTGTLILLSGWVNTNPLPVEFTASSTGTALNAGALSNDGTTWGDWLPTIGSSTQTAWDAGTDGPHKPVILRLRNINNQVTTVVTGYVDVDTTAPNASVTSLNAFHASAAFQVSWSGDDPTSGIKSYDVQYRDAAEVTWTDWYIGTTNTSSTFTGQDGHTYTFRARALDQAGNLGLYQSVGDTQTTVDLTPPTVDSLVINGGAKSSTSRDVSLAFEASDLSSGIARMSFSNDGNIWSDWQSFSSPAQWQLSASDETKTIYMRVQDTAGNISLPLNATITLDTVVSTEYGFSINLGSIFTNQVSVMLDLGALPQTTMMMISNDGGFFGAQWEPYTSQKAWAITQYGNYAIPRIVYARYKDITGSTTAIYQDDIILDVIAPSGKVDILPLSNANATPIFTSEHSATKIFNIQSGGSLLFLPVVVNSNFQNFTLALVATDDLSGVGSMMISNDPNFSSSHWEKFVSSKTWSLPAALNTVYVKIRDNAGNVSGVLTATVSR